MQVSQVNDTITHAVIGGGPAIEFGISNSAEFFHILSSTLYKDQKLAVVRETLCNAWDAHIEAGCTDKPVEITLTSGKFIIKDFGKGIHKDDMGIVYGTYGNSTKKNDGTQTGGFGLGCKSPFAYTEHFQVSSAHDGVKTIYTISKSSAQAMGKPGITPIASFPTTETGLEVSIEVLNSSDHHRFRILVERIARNGDMNMMINGTVIEPLGFDTSKSNYFITQTNLLDIQSRITIRYGNVIYPLDRAVGLEKQYDTIKQHLDKLGSYNLILQAPPNSITVQPSREGLSMQEHTFKTVSGLMANFMQTIHDQFQPKCLVIAKQIVDEAVKDHRIVQLLDNDTKLPFEGNRNYPTSITDLDTMAKRYMESHYPTQLVFRKDDITYRLKQMVKEGLLRADLVHSYLLEMKKVVSSGHWDNEATHWLSRNITGPLIKKMMHAGIDYSSLYVFDREDPKVSSSARYASSKDIPPLVSAIRARPKHLLNALPYLRNVVVLVRSQRNIMNRAKHHETFQKVGVMNGFLLYQVSMKNEEKDKAVAFFQNINMHVVDLTFKQEWELEPEPLPGITSVKVAAPRKAVKKGVPSLKAMLLGSKVNTHFMLEENVERIEAPEFMVVASTNQNFSKHAFERWNDIQSKYVIELFGDKGGITNNKKTFEKYAAQGAKPAQTYVRTKVCEYLMTSLTIKEYWSYHFDRVIADRKIDSYYDREVHTMVKTVYESEKLRNMFGLVNNLTEEDKKYLYLWDDYGQYQRNSDEVKAVQTYLDAIPLHPDNAVFTDKVRKSEHLKMINQERVLTAIKEYAATSPQVVTALALLSLVLK